MLAALEKHENLQETPLHQRPAFQKFEKILLKNNPDKATALISALEEIDQLGSLTAKKEALLNLLHEHDNVTYQHSMEICRLIQEAGAKQLKFIPGIFDLADSMKLHDIGKLTASQKVLNAPRGSEHFSRDVLNDHPDAGALLLEALGFGSEVLDAARFHHLREIISPDGSVEISGYPAEVYQEIYGERPLPDLIKLSKLFDMYEAITSRNAKRPYQEQMSSEKALQIMEDQGLNAGSYAELYQNFKAFILEKAEGVQAIQTTRKTLQQTLVPAGYQYA